MATITGQRARSTLPRPDTPENAEAASRSPDGLSRAAAEAAWHAVTPSIAGTQHVRISRDGGRTYPARHVRRLPATPPDRPCTVPVYDPGTGTGRMLALDLDPGRCLSKPAVTNVPPGGGNVTGGCDSETAEPGRLITAPESRESTAGFDGAAGNPAARVSVQAAELGQLLERLGGRYSPTSRRPVAATSSSCSPRRCRGSSCATSPGPSRCASRRSTPRRCPASAGRSPRLALVTNQAAGDCLRRRWRTPGRPLSTRTARRCGPPCWTSSRPNCATSSAVDTLITSPPASGTTPASPGCPASAAAPRSALSLSRSARSGRWDRSRYAGRSEARMAIVGAAVARGWRLAEVQSAVASGAWKGLAGLYERPSEPGRMERLLPAEWRKCTAKISGEENVRGWHTSDLSTRPPVDDNGLARGVRTDPCSG